MHTEHWLVLFFEIYTCFPDIGETYCLELILQFNVVSLVMSVGLAFCVCMILMDSARSFFLCLSLRDFLYVWMKKRRGWMDRHCSVKSL